MKRKYHASSAEIPTILAHACDWAQSPRDYENDIFENTVPHCLIVQFRVALVISFYERETYYYICKDLKNNEPRIDISM